MLARLRNQARHSADAPGQACPDPDGPPVIALASRDPGTQTVTLILDATANAALFAIAAHADEREAHIREVQRFGRSLPEGSYGRRNRQAIAARLRAVEHAYRTANERDTMLEPSEPTPSRPNPPRAPSSPERMPDREIELE